MSLLSCYDCIDGKLTKSVGSSELVKTFYAKHLVSVRHSFYSSDNEKIGKLLFQFLKQKKQKLKYCSSNIL